MEQTLQMSIMLQAGPIIYIYEDQNILLQSTWALLQHSGWLQTLAHREFVKPPVTLLFRRLRKDKGVEELVVLSTPQYCNPASQD